eukprot:g29218.t1
MFSTIRNSSYTETVQAHGHEIQEQLLPCYYQTYEQASQMLILISLSLHLLCGCDTIFCTLFCYPNALFVKGITIIELLPLSTSQQIHGKTIPCANAPNLLQSLIPERVTEGHTAQLQCTMRNAAVTRTDVHWYRERPENNTEWVLTHNVRNITQWSPGFTERFQSSRDPSNNSFILTITNVWPSDTGVYYCKVWGDISGNGTQLTVM